MADIVSSAAAASDPSLGSNTPVAAPAKAPVEPASSAPSPADLRLVIEEDQKAGCFVYKTVDWRTGEVVQQLPREQIVKLREADNYAAGDLIKSQA